jgi:hypothetical protein
LRAADGYYRSEPAAIPPNGRRARSGLLRRRASMSLLFFVHPRYIFSSPAIDAAQLAIRAPLSNYQSQIARRDSASCICRKSTGGFFL